MYNAGEINNLSKLVKGKGVMEKDRKGYFGRWEYFWMYLPPDNGFGIFFWSVAIVIALGIVVLVEFSTAVLGLVGGIFLLLIGSFGLLVSLITLEHYRKEANKRVKIIAPDAVMVELQGLAQEDWSDRETGREWF